MPRMPRLPTAVRAFILLVAAVCSTGCPRTSRKDCTASSDCMLGFGAAAGAVCCNTRCIVPVGVEICDTAFVEVEAGSESGYGACASADDQVACSLPRPLTPSAPDLAVPVEVDLATPPDLGGNDGGPNLDQSLPPDLSPFACGSITCPGVGYTCYNNLTCLACNIPQYCGPSCMACTGSTPFCCSNGTCGVMGVGGCM